MFEKLDTLSITIGEEEPEVIPFTMHPESTPESPKWFAGHDNFKLPNTSEPVLVKMLVTPKYTEGYETITYSFKAKDSDTISIPLVFAVNDSQVKNEQAIKTDGELASLLVQCDANLIKSVKIGEEGKEENCAITGFQDLDGNLHWRATKIVQLSTIKEKTFAIIVEPKQPAKYHKKVCKLHITGSQASNCTPLLFWCFYIYFSSKFTLKEALINARKK